MKMKKIVIVMFIFSIFTSAYAQYVQTFTFEKQKDLSVSLWNRDSKMSRIFWPIHTKTDFAVACVGNNLTRFIIKQKGVPNIVETIQHPELAETGYLVLRFEKKIKKIKVYYSEKNPLGFTVEVELNTY